jgi:hypothetical protein
VAGQIAGQVHVASGDEDRSVVTLWKVLCQAKVGNAARFVVKHVVIIGVVDDQCPALGAFIRQPVTHKLQDVDLGVLATRQLDMPGNCPEAPFEGGLSTGVNPEDPFLLAIRCLSFVKATGIFNSELRLAGSAETDKGDTSVMVVELLGDAVENVSSVDKVRVSGKRDKDAWPWPFCINGQGQSYSIFPRAKYADLVEAGIAR